VSRPPEFRFDFPARYELEGLERIERSPALSLAFSFPGADPVDPQREMADGIILAVCPDQGKPWIAVFDMGGYGSPPAAPRQVLAWPDPRSFCVVQDGAACVVRSDQPQTHEEIDLFPVCHVLAVPSHDLVVFAEFTTLVAYSPNGVAWQSSRLAWDDLQIVGARGDMLEVSGFDPTSRDNPHPLFTVDLRTGRSDDSPYVAES
jgi:hypothetical protein